MLVCIIAVRFCVWNVTFLRLLLCKCCAKCMMTLRLLSRCPFAGSGGGRHGGCTCWGRHRHHRALGGGHCNLPTSSRYDTMTLLFFTACAPRLECGIQQLTGTTVINRHPMSRHLLYGGYVRVGFVDVVFYAHISYREMPQHPPHPGVVVLVLPSSPCKRGNGDCSRP